ncbi:MAG: hypothetical protein CL424_19550 [Acidimicrobiaceae bacterium]|nr:hypothetical protein [Acidimicrobiaceae bacterium]
MLALTTVPAVDYADTFTLFTDVQATPEEWARAMFGDVPTLTERLIWRGLLGLRLAPQPSPANVAGWQVRARKLGSITLEAESSIVVGNLVVLTAGGQVSLGTFLHYRRRLGTCIWSPLSVVHRRLAPGLLRDAEATIRASR